MHFSELQALVVESSFTSRREIVTSLQESGIIQGIREAESVDDGLSFLVSGDTDTCLIGPTLSTTAAVTFIRQGTELLSAKGTTIRPCAFIAVTKEGGSIPDELLQAGISGLLTTPFERTAFTKIVQTAVGIARERWEHQLVEAPGSIAKHRREAEVGELPMVLREVAQRLRIVSQDIRRSRLSLGADGRPSLAARDAMRLAIEAALPTSSAAKEIGSYDNLFVSALVEWLVDRAETTAQNATLNLKRKLLSYSGVRRR